MRELEFIGTVRSHTSGSSRGITVPGREELLVAPADWPTQLAPGTLNIEIQSDGLPEALEAIGQDDGLGKLDAGDFRAALVIPQRKIGGNPVLPDPEQPTRGFAQVWRATLQVIGADQQTHCWMFRIIGSDDTSQIELVDREDLRSKLSLTDGAAVRLMVREAEPPRGLPTPQEWIDNWCEAARNVEGAWGRKKAMGYLIGEKFLNFLEVAETNREWREVIPSFVAEIKALFEPWQLAQYLETPRRLGALGHVASKKAHQMFREAMNEEERTREDARNLMLLEWAKELLLEPRE
jgi:hypothetical protein